ncbi:MAG: hypothetical protein R3292_07505 [Alcanivorax sp.]|nr:hypothetical protein [Alcanivorax sp.]
MTRIWTPDSNALAPYRQAQQQAYKAVHTIADALQPGMNEHDTALLLRDWLRGHQLHDAARAPRVRFFGESAARSPFGLKRQGKRRYRPGMIYQLQCDSVLNGHAARALLTGSTLDCALQTRLDDERQALLQALNDGQQLPSFIADRQDGVQRNLRQRLVPVTGTLPDGLPVSGSPLLPGLWQIQLVLRQGHLRAGFSELLVVDSDGARWLDPQLTHAVPVWSNGQAA